MKTPWYKFWSPHSGLLGGLLFALLFVVFPAAFGVGWMINVVLAYTIAAAAFSVGRIYERHTAGSL